MTLWGSPNKQTVSHRWHLLSAHSVTPEERSDCCSSNYPVREKIERKNIRWSLTLSNPFWQTPPQADWCFNCMIGKSCPETIPWWLQSRLAFKESMPMTCLERECVLCKNSQWMNNKRLTNYYALKRKYFCDLQIMITLFFRLLNIDHHLQTSFICLKGFYFWRSLQRNMPKWVSAACQIWD